MILKMIMMMTTLILKVTLLFPGDGEAARGEFAAEEILLRQNGVLHFITFAYYNFSKR